MDLGPIYMQKVSGFNLAYHRVGAGETVLLVHGITTYSFIWRRMVPLLKDGYDVIAIDLLGCGASDKPLDVAYSVKAHAKLLYEFITALDIKTCHLIGHDIGGGICQRFAVEHPERLFDLTLINSVAYDFWPVQPIIALRTPIIRLFAMAAIDVGALRFIVSRGLYHKDRLTPELMELFWEPLKTKEGRKAFLHFAKSLNNKHLMEIEDQLRTLDVPVLIIRGEADLYLSSEIAIKLHKEIKNSTLETFPKGGHLIQEDEPEQLSILIKNFIERNKHVRRS